MRIGNLTLDIILELFRGAHFRATTFYCLKNFKSNATGSHVGFLSFLLCFYGEVTDGRGLF